MARSYKPIPCSFYDMIELAAMRSKLVLLELTTDGDEVTQVQTTIRDTATRSDGEYILTDDGEFRMDRIVKMDGAEMKGYC